MAEQVMREVTLDEWCSKLWPGHRVNTELARLRAQLAEANEEARDNKIHADDFRAEAAGLKDRLSASESKRKLLERMLEYTDPGPLVLNQHVERARTKSDAANALEEPR